MYPLVACNGYRMLSRRVYEHVAVVERALGKPLPKGAAIHHIDGDKLNNDQSNLVVLQNQTEHVQLHARQRIQDAGGDWRTQKFCFTCGVLKYKDEFHNRKTAWDGRRSDCKVCVKKSNDARPPGYPHAARNRRNGWAS